MKPTILSLLLIPVGLISRYRRYLGFAAVGSGGVLILEHYITYGGTLHFTGFDHGVVGLALIIAGALAAGLKPGTRR